MKTFAMTVTGGNGAGKTSLMTAIYHGIDAAGLPVVAAAKTAKTLADCRAQLQRACAGRLLGLESNGQLAVDTAEFAFVLDPTRNRGPVLAVRELGIAALTLGHGGASDPVASSAAVVIAVDAAAVMESASGAASETERAARITDSVAVGWAGLERSAAVIVVPTKCERYLVDGRAAELEAAMREVYAPLWECLTHPPFGRRVAAAILPVATMGSVIFSHLEPTAEGAGQPVFRKRRADAGWAAWGGDRLLGHVLGHLVAREATETGIAAAVRRRAPWEQDWCRSPALLAWLAATAPIPPADVAAGVAIVQGRDLFDPILVDS